MSRPGVLERGDAIWLFAFGYFFFYVPYTGLTKALSKGLYPGAEAVPGALLLPLSTLSGLLVMLAFLWGTGWWRSATQVQLGGLSLPVPTRWTALSGLCTSAILTTTTLAYTFDGVSIVFVMLLMRGGVLILAPVVDALTGRGTRWYSWLGLALSMGALLVAFAERGGYEITALCALDIAVYLTAYLIRLRFMSRLAKSDDPETTKRYFVEEQLMATPMTLLLLVLGAAVGQGELLSTLRAGFTTHWTSGLAAETLLIGVFSQLVGIFGTLVFLDKRENTFSVPVNRSASILAGVVASALLAWTLGGEGPSLHQLGGAGLVIAAVLSLSLGPAWEARRA
ncbi:MAG: hypothetical protein H6741_31625 [Alphaproteobacteria bacterium]|nr:hypothetical protein [Alphaproteobacteria bacterium]MCB9797262.1 hypothetical protein [Alphaproteobacteria bacterium]